MLPDSHLPYLSILYSDPLSSALSKINQSGLKIIFVVDDADLLIGSLSDGDIRRGLLNGYNLSTEVLNVMNKDFLYMQKNSQTIHSISGNIFEGNGEDQVIPIVDESFKLLSFDLQIVSSKQKNLPNTAVIMAGGEGKRLRPLTNNCPKPMLKIGGKPILEIIIEQCIESGIQNIFISVNYLKSQIIDYFGTGSSFGISIEYLEEGKPLGTAGSLSLLPKDIAAPLLVMNGDILSTLNIRSLLEFHSESKNDATICVRDHQIQVPYGVVETYQNHLKKFSEKPIYTYNINAGIYVLDPKLLGLINGSEYIDMPSFLDLANAPPSSVGIFKLDDYWLDVGKPDTLNIASETWPLT